MVLPGVERINNMKILLICLFVLFFAVLVIWCYFALKVLYKNETPYKMWAAIVVIWALNLIIHLVEKMI